MAVGFKKSLFGFNCDDVMKYIERSQKSFAEKEKDLTNQVEELSKSLDLSNENYRKLNDEKELIAKKLADFSEKYEEIERLSENIGKLYLVAQARKTPALQIKRWKRIFPLLMTPTNRWTALESRLFKPLTNFWARLTVLYPLSMKRKRQSPPILPRTRSIKINLTRFLGRLQNERIQCKYQ